MTPHATVAVAFASALVDGAFAGAQALLAPALRRTMTPEALRKRFFEMFRGYASGQPRKIHFNEEFSGEDWPAKLPGDLGWVYVGIEGDDFVEGVTVTVARVGAQNLIREIKWGRP